MPIKGAKYRYVKGTHVRLAYVNGKVVEAKNMKTGDMKKINPKKRGKHGRKAGGK